MWSWGDLASFTKHSVFWAYPYYSMGWHTITIFIPVCTHMCAYMWMYVCLSSYGCICTYTHVCVCTCECIVFGFMWMHMQYAYVCVCTRECMCGGVLKDAYAHVYMFRLVCSHTCRNHFLELFLRHCPSYVFETVPFTGVGPSKKTTMAGQWAPGSHPLSLLQCWDYRETFEGWTSPNTCETITLLNESFLNPNSLFFHAQITHHCAVVSSRKRKQTGYRGRGLKKMSKFSL